MGDSIDASPPGRRQTPWRALLARVGLQGKLIIAFSLLLMVALVCTSALYVHKSHDALSDILGEQARQISQTLAMAAEPAYQDGDTKQLTRLGNDLLKSRNIVLVIFYDASGKPIATASRDPNFSPGNPTMTGHFQPHTQSLMKVQTCYLPSLGNFLQVTAPVVSTGQRGFFQPDSRLQGYLTVGISQNSERAQIRRVTAMGVFAGCAVFLLCLPLASGLVHRIFLPIRQLVDATHRIAGGDFDTQVATHRPDEIGMLARAFNDMVDRVRQQQQALRVANDNLADANRDLEAKVQLRTSELENTNRRLSSEIAEKEDFLRAVSHDLNAPLRNISGMAAMLLMKYKDRFDEDVIHRLERIRKNVEVETDLISELLELSRIKTRRQKMEPVDVGLVIDELRDVFEQDLKTRGIALIVETALPRLNAERARLRQVFQNLIDNAIKYMGDGPVREIRVGHLDAWAGETEFYVRDTGLGIHAEDQNKVFYVFRRGRNSADVKVAGKGVGLASVKSIVETYEGRIWVESAPGEGSTFRFTIHPKFRAAAAAAAAARAEMDDEGDETDDKPTAPMKGAA
jgi:signal transduction histidine kinase